MPSHRPLPSRLTALALAIVASVALGTAIATPGTADARPLDTGISGIGDYSPLSFERTRHAGAGFVRLALSWGGTAPETRPAGFQPENPADPAYDWTYFDRGVREAVRAGLNPVVLIDGAPGWASRCNAPPGLQTTEACDPDPAQLAAFATAAARRYSGNFGGLPRVQYWQILNEPNLTLFFLPQIDTNGKGLSPHLYREILNAGYAAIKAVNPNNLVLAGGLGPNENLPYNLGPMRFTRELLCMKGRRNPKPIKGACKGGVHFDIFDIHPYTSGGPTHKGRANDVQLGDLPKLQELLKAADRAKRIKGTFKRTPLWITEFSWDSNPPEPGGLPMKILTQWTSEAIHRAWSAGVTRFFWYGLRDDPLGSNSSLTAQGGLYFRGPSLAADQPKEVLVSFHFPFVAFPRKRGLEVWGRTPNSGPGKVRIQVYRKGGWRNLRSLRADRVGIFRATIGNRYGRNKKGAVRAVFRSHRSVPFPMKRVGDFYHPPFG